MVKLIIVLLSVQLVFLPVLAYADDTPKAAYVKKGEKAPFDGTLLNAPSVAKILADKKVAKEKCDENTSYLLNRQKASCKKDYDLLKSKSTITEKQLNDIIAIKNKQIKKTEEIAIKAAKSNNPLLWGLIGAAAGVATTIGLVFLIKGVQD